MVGYYIFTNTTDSKLYQIKSTHRYIIYVDICICGLENGGQICLCDLLKDIESFSLILTPIFVFIVHCRPGVLSVNTNQICKNNFSMIESIISSSSF